MLRGKPATIGPSCGANTRRTTSRSVEQDEPVGHSVRAMYLYAGGDRRGRAHRRRSTCARRSTACGKRRRQEDIRHRRHRRHRRGRSVRQALRLAKRHRLFRNLRNLATCFWNHRMFLLHGDAKYIDVLERAALQQRDLRRRARRQDVFLSQPARLCRQLRAQQMVRLRVLPDEPLPLHSRPCPAMFTPVAATRCTSILFVAGSADVELDGGKVHVEQVYRVPLGRPCCDQDYSFIARPASRIESSHPRLGAKRSIPQRPVHVFRRAASTSTPRSPQ